MGYRNLRECLTDLERTGQLVRIEQEIDPLRDIKTVDFDLIVNDLGQVEKRLERLEKDLKKMKTLELEREFDLIQRAKVHLEKELPLREMEISAVGLPACFCADWFARVVFHASKFFAPWKCAIIAFW